MKALRHKESGQWVKRLLPALTLGGIPMEIMSENTIEELKEWYDVATGDDTLVTITDEEYELVEIVVLERSVYEELEDAAWHYKELCK